MPLIGFAGAPFTLASYLVEGGPSKHHERTKALLFGEPGVWDAPADAAHRHRALRISWRRSRRGRRPCRSSTRGWAPLSGRVPQGTVAPHVRRLFDLLAPLGVPLIHFGVGTGGCSTPSPRPAAT